MPTDAERNAVARALATALAIPDGDLLKLADLALSAAEKEREGEAREGFEIELAVCNGCGVITSLTPEDCGCEFTGEHDETFYVSRSPVRKGDEFIKLRAAYEALAECIRDVADTDTADNLGASFVRATLRKRLGDAAMLYQTVGYEDLLRERDEARGREGDVVEKLREWVEGTSQWSGVAFGHVVRVDELARFLDSISSEEGRSDPVK